jgi:hypothetical protein
MTIKLLELFFITWIDRGGFEAQMVPRDTPYELTLAYLGRK